MRKMLKRCWRWARQVRSRMPKEEFDYREFENARFRAYKRDNVDVMHGEDQHAWFSNWDADYGWDDEEVQGARSLFWLRKARRLYVDLPPDSRRQYYDEDDYWTRLKFSDRSVLTDKGVAFIRRAIREETQVRQESLFKWLTIFIGVGVVVSPIASALIAYFFGGN